jgi:DNA-binding NarL/FixJ family response regulator
MINVNKIRIALVDDHSILREGLAIMLHQVSDLQIVGSFSSGEEIVSKFDASNPDVVIMDIMMNGMTGIEATRWLKERNSKVKIILLSGEMKKELVKAGIQSGIEGYLPKNVEKEILIEAIRTVYRGEKYFNDAVTALIFEDFYNKEKTILSTQHQLKTTDLTKRELEVCTLIATGQRNQEVADQLFISIKTVETHKTNILEKLGLRNTAQLVLYAVKNNLVQV